MDYEGYAATLGMAYVVREESEPGHRGAMTEAEKEHLIMECKDAKNRKEKQKAINRMVPGSDAMGILGDDEDAKAVISGLSAK